MSDPVQPLLGLRVIELGHSVAAPFAGQLLGDLGAEVIKIENPDGGDDARSWGPPFYEGAAATFQALNRHKRSLTLDLKVPVDLERLKKLAAQADVFLHNMRPGLAERHGFDAISLTAINPRLIYCSLAAYGDTGPLSDKPGYDPLMQAFSGVMSTTGAPGSPPIRVGPSLIDIGTGMWSVIGILSALLTRQQTGKGVVVRASLFETALALMTVGLANYAASGRSPGRSGSETPMLCPYCAYETSDAYVVIAAGNDKLFQRLCAALGHHSWAEDSRFRTNSDRVVHRQALNAAIQSVVRERTAAAWTEELNAAGVPCAPIQSVAEVASHPQTEAMGMIAETPDGRLQLVCTPLTFDGVRPPIRSGPPALGADTDAWNS